MHSSLSPSYLSVKASAANLLSFSIRRLTMLDRTLRETMKEQVEPTTVAVAARSQLWKHNVSTQQHQVSHAHNS